MSEQKAPISWYIWLALWILAMLTTIGTYQADPATALATLLGIGGLIILMIVKTKWVLPWFCVILIFDLAVFDILLNEVGTNLLVLIAGLLKEFIFLGYLIFSDNAQSHQGRNIITIEHDPSEA